MYNLIDSIFDFLMELFVQFLFDIICIEVAIVHILPFKIFNKTISALDYMVKRIFHYLHLY